MGTYVEAKLIEMSVSVLPQVDIKDTIVIKDNKNYAEIKSIIMI